jgi:hypothetical protein
MKPLIRAAGRPARLLTYLSGEGELVILVRTYWFPGEFYEANPESSARYIETITLHVEADSPPFCP